MHFIDIRKFKRINQKDINNALHRWLIFLDENASEEMLEELINMDAGIKAANKKMELVSQDKEALRLYQLREMAQMDYNSGMNKAKAEGKAEGLAEGKAEIAKAMLKDGDSNEKVARCTGLSLDYVKTLQSAIESNN